MEENRDKISIVVPVYNVGKFLGQCIESLCAQTYSNIEIILVNDGSTDNSLAIMQRYAEQDKRIRIIDQSNAGANVARNKGLFAATGDWICFVDGDDWIDLQMCEELSKYFRNDLDILFYSFQNVYPQKIVKPVYHKSNYEIAGDEFRKLQIATLNRLGNYKFSVKQLESVSVCDKLYRMSFLKNNKLQFDETLPKLQDLCFNLKVYDYAKKGYVLNIPYYNYRIHQKSVSKRYQPDIVQKFEVIHKALCQFMYEHDDVELKRAYYERIATHLRTCVVLNFCNADNHKSYKQRKKEFLDACNQDVFKDAMSKVDLRQFPGRERVLSTFIKWHWFWGCDMLYKLNGMYEQLISGH